MGPFQRGPGGGEQLAPFNSWHNEPGAFESHRKITDLVYQRQGRRRGIGNLIEQSRCKRTQRPHQIGLVRRTKAVQHRAQPLEAHARVDRRLGQRPAVVLGDLLELPKTKADWDQYRLTDEQVAFFHEHGYLAGVRILTDEQYDRLCGELAEFFTPTHPGHELWYEYHTNESSKPDTVLFHALGAWRIRPGFHDILWHPAFTVAASQLLGGAVRFWHDQLFCKPARHGGVVAWHQDYSYMPLDRADGVTAWLAIDPADTDNGCLRYLPGTHLLGERQPADFIRGAAVPARPCAAPERHRGRASAGCDQKR